MLITKDNKLSYSILLMNSDSDSRFKKNLFFIDLSELQIVYLFDSYSVNYFHLVLILKHNFKSYLMY